ETRIVVEPVAINAETAVQCHRSINPWVHRCEVRHATTAGPTHSRNFFNVKLAIQRAALTAVFGDGPVDRLDQFSTMLIAAAGAEWSAIGNDEITVGRNLQQEICLFGTDSRAGTITPDHDRDIIDTGQVRAINSVMRQGLCCMLNGVAERT